MLFFSKKNKVEDAVTEEIKKPVEKPVIDENRIKTIPQRYYNVRGPVLVEGWKEVERKVRGTMPEAGAEKPSGEIVLSEKEKQKQAKIEKKKREKEEKIRQKQLEEEQAKKLGKPSRAKLYITGASVILIVAIISVVIFYYFYQPAQEPPAVNKPINVNIAPLPVIPEPEPEPIPEPEPVIEPVDKSVFKDTDNDGLSDLEEEVYKSNIRDSDTDNDFYPDWLEVINAYNPTGFAPQKILPTGLVQVYSSEDFGASVYYPAPWDYEEVGLDVIFLSDIDETIKVTKNPNVNNLIIDRVAPQAAYEIREEDNLVKYINSIANTAYVQAMDKTGPIYIITLIKEGAGRPNFKGTFLMMVKSFSIL